MLLADAMQLWLAHRVKPNSREITHELYQRPAEELVAFAAQNRRAYLDEVTPDLLFQLREQWFERKLSITTINTYRRYLNTWFKYCVHRDWIEKNPVAKMEALRKKKDSADELDDEEETTLPLDEERDANWQLVHRSLIPFLQTRKPLTSSSIQSHPSSFLTLIELLYHTGLRISDGIKFDPRKIKDTPYGGSYAAPQTKTHNRVVVFLEPWLKEKLRQLPPLSPERYVFFNGASNWRLYVNDQIRRPLRILGKQLGFKETLRPHRFRDSFAVNRINAGTTLQDLKDLLGHKALATTERHYLPWVKSRQTALEERLYATKPDGRGPVPVVDIAARRAS